MSTCFWVRIRDNIKLMIPNRWGTLAGALATEKRPIARVAPTCVLLDKNRTDPRAAENRNTKSEEGDVSFHTLTDEAYRFVSAAAGIKRSIISRDAAGCRF